MVLSGLTCAVVFGEVDTNAVVRLFARMGRHRHSYMVDREFKTLSELPDMTRDGLSVELVRQYEMREGSSNDVDKCVRRRILSALDTYGTTNAIPLLEHVIGNGDPVDRADAVGSYLNLANSDCRAVRFFSSLTNFITSVDSGSRRSVYVSFADRLRTGPADEALRAEMATFLRAQTGREDVGAGALDEALCLCDNTYSESDDRRNRLAVLVPSGRVCPLDLARLRLELERLQMSAASSSASQE